MEGRCALNAEIVVRVHEGSRSYGLSAGWLTVYQQGRVQLPLAPPNYLREIRSAARTLVSKASYEGSSPSSPAISEHGMAAVPRASNPLTRVQLSLLAPLIRGHCDAALQRPRDEFARDSAHSSLTRAEFVQEQYPGSPVRRHGCKSRTPLQEFEAA